VKILLGQWERLTCRAVFALLVAAWLVGAGSVTSASAQDGPGLRAGLSVDPDQFYFGGHYVTKPIWDQMRFQPSVEAGFGDDVTVVAFNVEFAYWMPVGADWHAYVGGGPAMNLFSANGKGDDEDVGAGLTILAGFRRRGGLFFEMKVGAFDSPDFKLAVGYTFR
jgi:hypothetical protein